jgi:hypothetical protein
VIENVFGISVAGFGTFKTSTDLQLDNIHAAVTTCCSMHNFLRKTSHESYIPPVSFNVENAEDSTITLGHRPDNVNTANIDDQNPIEKAKMARELFLRYFNNGKISCKRKHYITCVIIEGDRKVMKPISDTCYVCQQINYIEIRKQRTMLY